MRHLCLYVSNSPHLWSRCQVGGKEKPLENRQIVLGKSHQHFAKAEGRPFEQEGPWGKSNTQVVKDGFAEKFKVFYWHSRKMIGTVSFAFSTFKEKLNQVAISVHLIRSTNSIVSQFLGHTMSK